jgi:uncharacterized membrane protein
MGKKQVNSQLIIIIAFFAIIYSLISLINHYNFRTYALDLGLYTNALYDYIHFKWNDSCVFKVISENLLADHFDLYLIIFSPLSLIFGSYTLLIVQITAILIGGIGVYKYFSIIQSNNNLSLFATIYFYLFFGIFSAVSYDYHSNVIAAMIVPWFFYYFRLKNYACTFILLLLLLVSKENISLWILFICLGLLFDYRKDKKAIRYLLVFASISIIYFLLVTYVVMPSISNNGTYPHFHYSALGNNSYEALKYLISHPIECIKMLFINHINHPSGNYVKLELHTFLLISGLFMLCFKPNYLIMLIPIYFQKLFHDNYIIWSIDAQYSIEFAPILTIGVFSVISKYKKRYLVNTLSAIVLIGTLISTIRTMDNTVVYTNKSKIRIYQPRHYKRNYNVKLIHKYINKIPQNAIISAQSPFLPHLALRDNIYLFPIVKDAEYIILSPKEDPYPISKEIFYSKMEKIMNSKKWQKFFENEDLIIFKNSM